MIFVTGDIHGGRTLSKLSSKNWPTGQNLTKKDYVIITGDFGLLWTDEPDSEEKWWKGWLMAKPWTTLFVDGNHENFNRLNALPQIEKFGSLVGEYADNILHLRRGNIYTIDFMKFFCLGGARSPDKLRRKIGIDWWPEEELNYAEHNFALSNLETNNNEVDFIISHTGPIMLIQLLTLPVYRMTTADTTSIFLEHVVNTVKFKKLYCGHFHVDKEIHKFRVLMDDIIEIKNS